MAETANTDERLTQINAELSSLLEAKMEFLTRTLNETQRFTQKIANTELETVSYTHLTLPTILRV